MLSRGTFSVLPSFKLAAESGWPAGEFLDAVRTERTRRLSLARGKCQKHLEQHIGQEVKKGGAGARSKQQFCEGWNKLQCPKCFLYLKESKWVAEVETVGTSWTEGSSLSGAVPALTQLTHNHRSTDAILELAQSLLDLLLHFFDGKIDKLDPERSKVKSASRPTVLEMSLDSAKIKESNRGSE